VIANFDANPQYLDLDVISGRGINLYGQFVDLVTKHDRIQAWL
jgi:amylosucrase